MTETKYDIVGIGNAIVDVLAYKDKAFLEEENLPLGSMILIDEERAEELYKLLGTVTECSGGSTANSLAGIAMLGGDTAFVGKVRDDQLGRIFRKDLKNCGVAFDTTSAERGKPTANCLIMVTSEENKFGNPPKVERTMATYLGISGDITENDIDERLIASGQILYFEGYLWDSETAREAIKKAVRIAKKHDRKVAFSLSDSLCVMRHHQDFIDLIDSSVDILFANESEIEALCNETDIRKILFRTSGQCETAVITRSEKGSYILEDGNIHEVDAVKVSEIYDVTGAGDLYASGFLYGYINGFTPDKCGRLGSLCASEVIRFLGARPLTKLADLLDKVD